MSIVMRKFARRGIDVAPAQLVLVGEADGVDHEIERAPHAPSARSNSASSDASSATSHSTTRSCPIEAASGSTRFFSASP